MTCFDTPTDTTRTHPTTQTHHWAGVGHARRLQQHGIKRGPRRGFPAFQLFERVHQVGPQGAAHAAALQVDDVFFRDEVGGDCSAVVRGREGVV